MDIIPSREFSPVCSLGIHQALFNQDFVPRYFLLLAHNVLDDAEDWRDLINFAREYHHPDPIFVIMDNSLIELGKPMEAFALIEACGIVDADVLVLPDMLCEPRLTVEMSRKAVAELDLSGLPIPHKTRFMAVVQGTRYPDMVQCAEALVELPRVDYLAVPRITVANLGTREYITQALWLAHKKYMHLLGFSDNVADDIKCARLPGVMGIDSALPVVLGLANRRLYTTAKPDPQRIITTSRIDRPEGYLDKRDVDMTDWVYKNCVITRDLVRGVSL